MRARPTSLDHRRLHYLDGQRVSEGGLEVYHCPTGHPAPSQASCYPPVLRGYASCWGQSFPNPNPGAGRVRHSTGPPPGFVITRRSAAVVGDDTVLSYVKRPYPPYVTLSFGVACRPGGCCGLLVAVPRIGASGVPPLEGMALRSGHLRANIGYSNLGVSVRAGRAEEYQCQPCGLAISRRVYIYIYM